VEIATLSRFYQKDFHPSFINLQSTIFNHQ